MIIDHTRPALLQKQKRSYNPLPYLWTAWEHFAFFFAPANGCQYCWVLRMFILGILLGAHVTYSLMKR